MTRQEFIENIKASAIELYQKTGILPSITISQAALESNFGNSKLATTSNNLFGVKGKGEVYQTKEYVDGKMITTSSSFKVYDSWLDSLLDYGNLLTGANRYKGVVSSNDYKTAAAALGKSGYATDPNYESKITNIIEQFGLDKLDDEVSGKSILDILGLGKITSYFGIRNSPTKGASTNHKGIDIVLTNPNVPSIFSGTVTETGYTSARGNYIKIRASDGTTALYQHLKNPVSLIKGQFVKIGETIGIMGSTGISTGDHLHLEIQQNGSYIDPLSLKSVSSATSAFSISNMSESGINNMSFWNDPLGAIGQGFSDAKEAIVNFFMKAGIFVLGIGLAFLGILLLFGEDTTLILEGGK